MPFTLRWVSLKAESAYTEDIFTAIDQSFSSAMSLRPPLTIVDRLKLFLLTKIKRYSLQDVSAAVLVFEGGKLVRKTLR